jgi:hypothetical protein
MTTGTGEGGTASARDIDVGLAEFNALRAEIISRTTAQNALVGIGLTAVGVIYGLALKKAGDDKSLLLAVPPLAALASLLHASETYQVGRIGDYIRETAVASPDK